MLPWNDWLCYQLATYIMEYFGPRNILFFITQEWLNWFYIGAMVEYTDNISCYEITHPTIFIYVYNNSDCYSWLFLIPQLWLIVVIKCLLWRFWKSNFKVRNINVQYQQYYHVIWNHQQLNCLFNSLFRITSQEMSKFPINATSWGEPLVTNGFPSQSVQ